MKKVKLMMTALMMCLMTSVVFGQWTYTTLSSLYYSSFKTAYTKTINSKPDGSFKKAYTKTNKRGYLVMEFDYTYNSPVLSLWSYSFYVGDIYIDFVLVVNGVDKKYKLTGRAFDNRVYYFNGVIWTDEFIKDFKSASKCSIIVYQDYCPSDYYQFDFSGSEAAFDFITK